MSTPEADRIETLFQRALDLPTEERAPFLDAACGGEDDVRESVESLLASYAAAPGGFLPPSDRVRDGAKIADYTILERIGQGGMGTVYAALQSSPRREVALKVVRPGRMSASALRRFRLEIDALGSLQHPGIAQIYEAGSGMPDEGAEELPFFAMELVRGEPVLAFAETHDLSVKARAELMARICDAVNHAHLRGVIHRDLKPDNVLVLPEETTSAPIDEEHRGVGQPKILDFGIARVIREGHTLQETEAGELVGTLSHMSPEQIEGDSSRVDVRSDVYALGVVAYQLLGGRLPIDLIGCNVPEAFRRIRDEDPQPLGSFRPELRGDIGTIVGHALEKDPGRRYSSASALADDLRRFVRGEPILARSDSGLYLLQKRLRRHRLGLAIAVGLAILLGAFAVVFAKQAHRNEVLAASEAEARRLSDQDLGQALDVLDVLTTLGSQELRDVPEAAELRVQILEAALGFHEDFLARHGKNDELRARVARSRTSVGILLSDIGRNEEALEATRSSVRDLEVLDEAPRALFDSHEELGRVARRTGRYAEAEGQFLEALALGEEQIELGDDWYAARLPELRRMLALTVRTLGRPEESLTILRRAREEAEDQVRLSAGSEHARDGYALIAMQIGIAHIDLVQHEEAEQALAEAYRAMSQLHEERPEHVDYLTTLMAICSHLNSTLTKLGRKEEGGQYAESAVEFGRRLIAHDPDVQYFRSLFAQALINHGYNAASRDDDETSLASQREAIEQLEILVGDDPATASPDFVVPLSIARGNTGGALVGLGRHAEALPLLNQNRADLESFLTRVDHPQARECLHMTKVNTALALAGLGDHQGVSQMVEEIGPSTVFLYVDGVLQALAQAIELTREDESLAPADAAVLADMYMTQACEYLFGCFEDGYRDIASLANGPELALLFDDPGFAAIADSLR